MIRAEALPKRILIIKPSSLGDVVHALPVLYALRAAYPGARIAWLVSRSFAPLLENHPLLDEVIIFDRRRFGRMLQSPRILLDFCRFVVGLRRRRFDLVVDLQGLVRSGFLAFASGARRRVGFASARELAWLFYSQRVRCPNRESHAVDKNLHLARAMDLPVDEPRFPLGLQDAELSAARRRLAQAASDSGERFTALIIGARWDTKRWRADRWAELIDRLAVAGCARCALLGGPDDLAFADKIRSATRVPTFNLVGQTSLRELAALLAIAELVICHDSGPMHIAAALGKPIVALFGPTNPRRTGPFCNTARIVSLPLDCAPCYRRRCPLEHHDCMQKLDVETVLAHVRELRPAGGPGSGATDSPSLPPTAGGNP